MYTKHSMDFLDLMDDDDFGDWAYEEDEEDFDDENESFDEEDELEYYFSDNNMFFCPRCESEYEQFEAMEECFNRCQKARLNS